MKSLQVFAVAVAVLPLLLDSAQAAELGADRHQAAGVKCEACHGPDASKPATPDFAVCTGCHKVDELVKKTAKVKPANPHTSPHYGNELECTNCHAMHSPSTDYCAQCHNFKYQVP